MKLNVPATNSGIFEGMSFFFLHMDR